ncbi:GNAT family N-acetyltransferase [Natronobacterium texcoconense]|uniref:Protein N-acetyltransferase, RimJ/RimL family n=1 Tax=Natronobacterium texcoconense TaxID=1095778 RepID=A0A1H1F228_NATTX|nr:GNAT family N-acetyltransferase [Natronobacterium texcoconense]SDQ94496.1 Protein N-acetyltransferase, RimJ/RimL family [Natronobacterium texcoconense]
MTGAVFLEEETVTLRTIETEDGEFVQQTFNDPRVRRCLSMYSPISGHEEREWIESIGDDDGVHLLVCVDGDPVGTASLDSPNEAWGSTEIAYMITPEEWGNGYATDAVRCLCRYAFDERRLNKVYARVYETNVGSQRVLEKVGFEKEGTLRKEAFVEGEYIDLYRYGLLAEDSSFDS